MCPTVRVLCIIVDGQLDVLLTDLGRGARVEASPRWLNPGLLAWEAGKPFTCSGDRWIAVPWRAFARPGYDIECDGRPPAFAATEISTMQRMSLGLRERRVHRRRQMRWRLFKWTVTLAAIVAAGVYSYETGNRLAEREVTRLHEEIDGLALRIEELEEQNARLADTAALADQHAQEWQQRYRREIPSGEIKKLYDLTRRKLEEGVNAGRLAFVLSEAADRTECADGIETKRFYVKTPLYRGANDAVSFGNNVVTVTAQGVPAVDGAGNQQARYDPAKPVVVRFSRLGGDASEATGLLPLHHALVIGDSEYRFSMVAGAAGMMKVTGGRCSYP